MKIRLFRLLCYLVVVLAAAGCDRYVHTPQCSELLEQQGFPQHLQADGKGSVLDTETGLRWYRCSAGQRFSNGQCIGDPIKLSQLDAKAYAQEFSARANQDWRLPSVSEMRTLRISGCLNPAINTEVFPGILIDNYWTGSTNVSNPGMGCTMYTFNGNAHCREVLTQPRPFLLVLSTR